MRPKVGDYVQIGPSNYNERGDNLNMMRGYVSKVDDVFVYVKVDAYYRMRGVQRVMHGGAKVVKKTPQPVQRVEFEFRCTRKKCRNTQWVKGNPFGDVFLMGSQANFCDQCQHLSMKHTGLRRTTFDKPRKGVLEVVESTKTYRVEGHAWGCGVSHSIWPEGPTEEDHGIMGVWPLEATQKCLGPGGRVRVTMTVEVLKSGETQRRFHDLTGKSCRSCRTNKAAPGKMHIAVKDGWWPKEGSGTFCGKIEGFPVDFPKGHDFVYQNDADRATCKGCLAAWDKKEEKRKAALRKDDKDGD